MKSVTPTSLDRSALLRGARALGRTDPGLAGVLERYGAPPMWSRSAGFSTLLRIILEQQVSLASADATYRKLSARLGRVTPGAVLDLDDAALRTIGFSRQKTVYARALSSAIVDRRLRLRDLRTRSDVDVTTELMRIPGIGPWTAHIFLLMALRRPDVWPPGDLALAKSVRSVHDLAEVPDAEALTAISDAWRPWRSVAARILWHGYLSDRRR